MPELRLPVEIRAADMLVRVRGKCRFPALLSLAMMAARFGAAPTSPERLAKERPRPRPDRDGF